jgi:Fe(3+) dicitrate transport protein
MNIKITLISILIFLFSKYSFAQNYDSTKVTNLSELFIKEQKNTNSIERMPDIKDNAIYAGKKTDVINLDKINADLSINNTRQIFSKVPGIQIWENDGSGIQTNVSTRGLSPNRSWEFNVRQNGYDIASEAFGYPEAYYTPPAEALSKIELVRGAASLQYGTQFGGLLNYQIKKGNPNKPITFEQQITQGNYGLFNSYSAIGGTVKKWNYYAFFHQRKADGWRDNSEYNTKTFYAGVNYQFTKKLNIGIEYTNMDYSSQQPGGLTDIQFNTNAKQSTRDRNWLGTPWNVANLTIKYDINSKLNLLVKTFATFCERNSVGFIRAINVVDTINPNNLQYSPRQVDRDFYTNIGTEARLIFKYNLFKLNQTLATGVRAYIGNTQRKQLGEGTTGSDFDIWVNNNQYGRDLTFQTQNVAIFAENIFNITKHFKIVPGIRYEGIINKIEGSINGNVSKIQSDASSRNIILAGVGSEYNFSNKTTLYANFSQAYRPVTFSEFTPASSTDVIDPNLKDANGYNADLGYRGVVKNWITFDISVFYLNYNNRIGTIIKNGNNFRTNIGQSASKGIESYIELNLVKLFTENNKFGNLSLFSSNSFIEAKYVSSLETDPLKSYNGKWVENAPQFINRFGLTYGIKSLSATLLYSNTSQIYTDALNTETPNSNYQIGKIDGYKVIDLSASYGFLEHYNIKTGVNNLTDEVYATRRAGGYPGPGLIPGNGRTYFFGFGVTF